jgi:hypothetical protein
VSPEHIITSRAAAKTQMCKQAEIAAESTQHVHCCKQLAMTSFTAPQPAAAAAAGAAAAADLGQLAAASGPQTGCQLLRLPRWQ